MTDRKKKRLHVAKGSRIAAVGLGTSMMLGLVGAMGYYKQNSPSTTELPKDYKPTRLVVIVHRSGVPDTVVTSMPAQLGPAPGAARAELAPPTNAITAGLRTVLRARPTVRSSAPRTQAPVTQTSGSR